MKIQSNLIGNYKRLRNDNKNDRLVGTTYIRDYATGTDKFYEFEIPQAKMDPAQTITMQAEGDPSTFSMTMKVLRPSDGVMMRLRAFPDIDVNGVQEKAAAEG